MRLAWRSRRSAHRLVVVGVAEERPVQVELLGTTGHELAHRQRVRLLLHDQVRPERLHHHGRRAGELPHGVEQPRVVQRQVVAERRASRRWPRSRCCSPRWRPARVPPGLVHPHRRRVVGAEQPERHEEDVQQAGVVRVLDVLEHQLPVRRDPLALVAEQRRARRRRRRGRTSRASSAPRYVLERRRVDAESRRTPRRGARSTASGTRPCSASSKSAGMPPSARPDALAERHADQPPVEVVGPLVVRARELVGVPASTHGRTARRGARSG